MYCPKCGTQNEQDNLFCWKCGTGLQKYFSKEEKGTTVIAEQPNKKEVYRYEELPNKKETGIRSVYIMDFIMRLGGKSNIPLCIYLVLNVIIIGLIVTGILALPIGWGMLCGLLLYIASVAIALSPIGEAILRHQNGCRKINEAHIIHRIEPLFREVYYKAKKENPEISKDIRLFINDAKCPNAFATGRKTICITKGMLDYSDEEIKATLGHEFGHLAHKDTDRILVVAIGNTAITVICLMFQLGALIMQFIMKMIAIFSRDEDGFFAAIFGMIASFITMVLISAFMKVWTKLGVLLCMKTNRENEYLADKFSFDLGYGEGLTQFLSTLPGEKAKGLFASLSSSHPENEDRIARLQTMKLNGAGAE